MRRHSPPPPAPPLPPPPGTPASWACFGPTPAAAEWTKRKATRRHKDKRMMVRIGTKAHPNRPSSFAILHGFLQLFTLTDSVLPPAAFMLKRFGKSTRAGPAYDLALVAALSECPCFSFLARGAARCYEALRTVRHRPAVFAEAHDDFAFRVAALVESGNSCAAGIGRIDRIPEAARVTVVGESAGGWWDPLRCCQGRDSPGCNRKYHRRQNESNRALPHDHSLR